MISITFTDQPLISFNGPFFYETLKLLKRNFFTYIPETQLWSGSPSKVLAVLTELNDIEPVKMDRDTHLQLIEASKPILEVRKRRFILNKSLIKVPPIVGKEPNKNYQYDDLKNCLQINRKGIFWEMGLGKGWLGVNIMNQLFHAGDIDKCLILVPDEGVVNWKREIIKFSGILSEDQIFIANRFNRKPFEPHIDIVIMTYTTFLMISDDYYELKTGKKGTGRKYRNPPIPFEDWGTDGKRMIIVDESHKIKNYTTRTAKALHLHKHFFEYRYLLTGTPADKVEDYFSQIKFLDDNLLPSTKQEWLTSIANIGTKYSEYAVDSYIPEKVDEFIKHISPYIVRRETADHLELPENYISPVYVQLTGEQKEIYKLVILNFIEEQQKSGSHLNINTVMKKFQYLTFVLNNPEILKKNIDKLTDQRLKSLIKKWNFSKHCKIPATTSLIEKYFDENRKVILWSGHPHTIDQMALYYKKYKPFFIHGAIETDGLAKNDYRDQMLESFKKSKDRNLLIASYKVLNTAVTITEATRNIYFDRSYSLTEWLQSQKRTHRIGQNEAVITNPLIFEDTLDERLDIKLRSKEDIDKKLLKRGTLSPLEWKAIFTGKI